MTNSRMTNDEGMTKPESARDYEARFWSNGDVAVVREEPSDKRVYDLEERTARFGEAVIDFAKSIPQNPVTSRIITQLVGAATSVGANYVEADDAVWKKEFLKNIGTCRKEARETKHFPSHGRSRRPGSKTPSPDPVARSARTPPHLLQDSEKRPMTFVFRASTFLRHSSFVIRHSSFSPCLILPPSSK
jgi:four helix bundle protein